MYSGSNPGLTHAFSGVQNATGCGHQGGVGVSGVDPVQQARALTKRKRMKTQLTQLFPLTFATAHVWWMKLTSLQSW